MAGSSRGRSSSPSRQPWEASSSGLGSLRSSGPAGPPPPSSGQRVPSLLGSPVREAILGRRKTPRSPDSIVAAPSAAMSDRSALNAIFPPPALWPTGPVVGHPIRPRRLHAPFHQEIDSGGEILLRADGRPASATRWPIQGTPAVSRRSGSPREAGARGLTCRRFHPARQSVRPGWVHARLAWFFVLCYPALYPR